MAPDAKGDIIFFSALFGIVLCTIGGLFLDSYLHDFNEASDAQYEEAEQFFMEPIELKDMLQDAMSDSILTIHEFNRIDERWKELREEEKVLKEEEKKFKRRDKLWNAVYEKETKE